MSGRGGLSKIAGIWLDGLTPSDWGRWIGGDHQRQIRYIVALGLQFYAFVLGLGREVWMI